MADVLDPEPESECGGADLATVAETAIADLGSVPAVDSQFPLGMVLPLIRYVRRWLSGRAPDAIGEQPAVFVFSEYPRIDRETQKAVPHSHLYANLAHDIQGRVHFSSAQLKYASSIVVGFDSLDAVQADLAGRGLIERPTAIILPDRRVLLWCPRGVADEDTTAEFEIPDEVADVTQESVERALRHFHKRHAEVPDPDLEFWKDPGRFVPGADLERTIQKYLHLVLSSWFCDSTVIKEATFKAGRIDLVIYAYLGTDAPLVVACNLELKVLKSKHYCDHPPSASRCSRAENEDAVIKGVDQAAETKEELKSPVAFLCCYDVRDTDDESIMACVVAAAARRNVFCRRYFMYNSKESFRRAQPESAYQETAAYRLARRNRRSASPSS
jgi:hypothetical protein